MKRIAGFCNYFVTVDGRVRSMRGRWGRGCWLKPHTNMDGYLRVSLCSGGHSQVCTVHRLVLQTFVGPCPPGMQCRHLNGVRTDNRLGNLCWGTPSENNQDTVRHGTYSNGRLGVYGEDCPASKLSDRDRRLIFSIYHDGVYTQQELADHFGISQMGISKIVNNVRWGSCV